MKKHSKKYYPKFSTLNVDESKVLFRTFTLKFPYNDLLHFAIFSDFPEKNFVHFNAYIYLNFEIWVESIFTLLAIYLKRGSKYSWALSGNSTSWNCTEAKSALFKIQTTRVHLLVEFLKKRDERMDNCCGVSTVLYPVGRCVRHPHVCAYIQSKVFFFEKKEEISSKSSHRVCRSIFIFSTWEKNRISRGCSSWDSPGIQTNALHLFFRLDFTSQQIFSKILKTQS